MIQDKAFGEKIELYTTVGGLDALKDVVLLMIYLTSKHDEIIEDSGNKRLYLIISDSVVMKNSDDIIGKIF